MFVKDTDVCSSVGRRRYDWQLRLTPDWWSMCVGGISNSQLHKLWLWMTSSPAGGSVHIQDITGFILYNRRRRRRRRRRCIVHWPWSTECTLPSCCYHGSICLVSKVKNLLMKKKIIFLLSELGRSDPNWSHVESGGSVVSMLHVCVCVCVCVSRRRWSF